MEDEGGQQPNEQTEQPQQAQQPSQPAQPDMRNMSKSERKALKRRLKEERKRQEESAERGAKRRKTAIRSSLVILILAVLGALVFMMGSAPGQYDGFAKCLKSTGAVIYGNDFCEYTKRQMGVFGKSFSFLNYVRCSESGSLCASKGVTQTPTWEVNGSMLSGVQTFQNLAEASGCRF